MKKAPIAGFVFVLVSLTVGLSSPTPLFAQTTGTLQDQIDSRNEEIKKLNDQIAKYQAELVKVGADKKTLQAAINGLNIERQKVESQISVIQKQMDVTQLEIQKLGRNINETQKTIDEQRAALSAGIRTIKMVDDRPLIVSLISSTNLSDFWHDVDQNVQVAEAIQDHVAELGRQKQALASSQSASKTKRDQLATQRKSLATEQQNLAASKKSKAQLLAETQAQEANYQKLLAAAKAQLASFSAFTANQGGAKLLANQTSCDDWGCYYSQRDASWGNMPLNGTSYKLASDGCLVTSMAMVLTHYGYRNVTPVTINSNPNNFASYFPAYLLFTIQVDGATATRKAAAIDASLAAGDPVVVGVRAYGGTHFVVITGGRGGQYIMRDPYIANGKDISFNAHYSVGAIFGVNKVVITKS